MNLSIRNLSKSFGHQLVLDDINLEIDGINSIGVIGPSGGGKSTLLRIVGALENIDKGVLDINSFTLDSSNMVSKNFRKGLGIVFQAYSLFPHLTALNNIVLVLRKVHKWGKDKAIDRAESFLKRFDLYEHRNKKPHQLSGGQKQRVAIVRALAIDVELLLFDEPTSALDPILTADVLEMIEGLKREAQKDFMIVTHHMGFARSVSDYLLFVADKKIVEHGYPQDLFDNPQTPELKHFFEKTLEFA